MHLFVTGGTGFFGKSLLRYWNNNPLLISDFDKITILTRNPNGFRSNNSEILCCNKIHLVEGDIMSPSTLQLDESITHILHAATDSTNGLKLNPLYRYSQIVDGTRNILNFAVDSKVKRLLLTSSGGVYGPQPADMLKIPESYHGIPDPMDQNSAYGMGKRAAEHLCALYGSQYNIQIVVARCFAFVGQDLPLDAHFAIGNFMRDALFSDEISINGDGSPVRSYMHQDDLARWLTVMLINGKNGGVYNLGSDEMVSIKQLAYKIRDLVSPGKKISMLGRNPIGPARSLYVPNIDLAENDLQLSINFDLQASISNVAEALLSK